MTRQQTARTPATTRINVTLSMVHLVCIENHNLLHKLFEKMLHGNHCRANDRYTHRRENAKNQRWHELDGRFGSFFFCLLPTLGRNASENAPSDLAIGVPKRSV
jgi:hypothetical protein